MRSLFFFYGPAAYVSKCQNKELLNKNTSIFFKFLPNSSLHNDSIIYLSFLRTELSSISQRNHKQRQYEHSPYAGHYAYNSPQVSHGYISPYQ